MTDYTKAAREACLRAADRIAEKGWHQGSMFKEDEDGTVANMHEAPSCAMGALHACVPRNFDFIKTINCATDLLKEEIRQDGTPWPNVPHWNDAPDRTAEDVILALKRVGTGE